MSEWDLFLGFEILAQDLAFPTTHCNRQKW